MVLSLSHQKRLSYLPQGETSHAVSIPSTRDFLTERVCITVAILHYALWPGGVMVRVSPVFSVSPGIADARILSSTFTTKPPHSHSLFVYDKIKNLLQRRSGVITISGKARNARPPADDQIVKATTALLGLADA